MLAGLEHAITVLYTLLFHPFIAHTFLRNALLGCTSLALGCGAIGSFLVLRRMSLAADALSHGLFPGVALAFLLWGFHPLLLSVGGACTGIILALVAHWIATKTNLSKDSTFAILVLFSMAFGLFILSAFGGYTDVMHILIGNILAISHTHLFWMVAISTLTLCFLALFYRLLVLQAFDSQFFRTAYGPRKWLDFSFLTVVTLNMVCAFQALGSLMALGLLLTPAITARLWARHITTLCVFSGLLAFFSGFIGLLLSYHFSVPSGPLIVLVSIAFYGISFLLHVSPPRLRTPFVVGCVSLFICLFFFIPNRTSHPQVVVSFSVLEDLTRAIVKDTVTIKSLVPPECDPHTFEPSPQNFADLARANLIILNGLHLENHWLPRVVQAQRGRVVYASQTTTPRYFWEGDIKASDPHAWHDVQAVRRYVRVITKALCKTWPQHATFFQKNAKTYDKKLEELDTWIHTQMARIPREKRIAITTHDAFSYFSKAYGFSFLSPLGPSTSAEPSAHDIAALIRAAKEQRVTAIFFEHKVAPHLTRMLAREAELKVGGTLYADGLSVPDGPASTYIEMIKHNTNILLSALF